MKQKMIRKMMALTLATTFAVSLCACDKVGMVLDSVDESKTQLHVFNYDGGFGSAWLDPLKKRFEETYANESFEKGKKGVEVKLELSKTVTPDQVFMTSNHVIVAENLDLARFQKNGDVLDITDVVTATNSDNKTIESKLLATQKETLKFDNKYYALPHYQIFGGITYDKELFDLENFYFADEASQADADGFIINAKVKKSRGPDGKYDTYDDGLPATNEEFIGLCRKIKSKGYTPFMWSGQNRDYTGYLLTRSYSSLMGEALEYNTTFDSGENTVEVAEVNDKGEITYSNQKITNETGYYLTSVSAKLYALQLLESIIDGGYYDLDTCFGGSVTHIEAQRRFVYSAPEGKPCAMFVEGNYWANEGKQAFVDCAKQFPNYAERQFAFMPLPSVDKGTHKDVQENVNSYTMLDTGRCYMMVNANTVGGNEALTRLAKEFVKFAYTDTSLEEFTVTTGTAKGVMYTISEEAEEKLPYFNRSLWDMRQRAVENDVFFLPIGTSDLFKAAQSLVTPKLSLWDSKVGNETFDSPIDTFKALDGLTAVQYFKGIPVSASEWKASYEEYFKK